MEKEIIKISEREEKCLKVLAGSYEDEYDVQRCLFFRTVAKETGLPEDQVRKAVRSLARKGLAEYHTGLVNEDGFIVGSGYRATEKGASFFPELV